MGKIYLLIEDDWELMGNGSGSVGYHQYIPAYHFLKIANSAGLKVSFMVETVQGLQFERYKDKSKYINSQYDLWKESIEMIESLGGDIQLHLHPQWLNAKFVHDTFYVDNKWSIGQYKKDEQQFLVRHGIDLLKNIKKQNNQIIGFKAGSWGLQPSSGILNVLENEGIKIVMGVRKGLKIPSIGLDYSNLEVDKTIPYHPDYEDINRVGNGNIVVFPLSEYRPDILTFIKYAINNRLNSLNKNRNYYLKDDLKFPRANPLNSKEKLTFSFRPYTTHLKIGNEKFSYLKKSFDYQINKILNTKDNSVLIIETHTKMFHGFFYEIEKFLHYIKEKYGSIIESVNVDDLNNILLRNELIPLKK